MTPPAATAAGRAADRTTRPTGRTTARTAAPASRPVQPKTPAPDRAHRRTVRPAGPVPRAPRRVSGPSRAAVAEPQRLAPPRRPSVARPSLPKRGASRRQAERSVAPRRPLHLGILAGVRALPDHRFLDRLVRGRLWIPLLGVLLTGIVGIQVEVLKLGASIGRSVTWATQLESRNQLLRDSVAQLSDEHRIMREAAKLGMFLPGPTEVHFVPAHGRGALGKAIHGITAPDAQGFLAALAQQESTDGVTNPALGTSSPAATGTTVPGAGVANVGGTTSSTGGIAASTGATQLSTGAGSGAATVTPTAPTAPTTSPPPTGTGQSAGGATGGASTGTGGVAG